VRRSGLRPVDAAMFAFYLVLWVLAVVGGVRGVAWLPSLVLSAVCFVLWVVARLELGASFSVGAQAHELVVKGLYTKLRHPIYLFGTGAFLLVLLALNGWQALVIWAVLVPVQVVRARREQHVLEQAFGADYAAYRASTWF
jgi:protein-S-isoprenylcysteine O-methyltransferase Ste14